MHKLRSNKGAAMIEFALILPILVVLLFGTVEFGILLFDKAVITNASREGCRAGIVAQVPRVSAAEIEAVVDNYAKDHLITFGASNDPVTSVTKTGDTFGDDLTVAVSYTYDFLVLPGFITSLSGPLVLQATTVMKME